WSTSKTPSYTKSVSWQHHPRIDSFSSSVICGQITEGSYLSIIYLLIGNRLKILYLNNFWYLPINK
ncbi:hypothetical protein, partial [Escherichia coli]|uniref:hypothetical protein n=1 Tax=Escherichia coli TaxID=562 RepID=UPI001BC867C6